MAKLQVDAHFSEPAYPQCRAIQREVQNSWCMYLVYAKTVDSVFRVLWLVAQSRNILHYSLIRLQPCGAKLLQVTCTTKMAQSRFATVTSDEISKINEEAIPDNTKKATKFGLAFFTGKALSV